MLLFIVMFIILAIFVHIRVSKENRREKEVFLSNFPETLSKVTKIAINIQARGFKFTDCEDYINEVHFTPA